MNGLPLPTVGLEESANKKATRKEVQPPANKNISRLTRISDGLAQLYATIGLFVTRADIYDGVVLMKEAQNRANEVVNVARHHKGMLDILERMVESNDYVALAMGHGMMIYALMAHHGRIKADPVFLAQFGYSEAQVLAPPEGMNGNASQFADAVA